MRIFASFFVIFNHTGNRGFFLFSVQQDKMSFAFWVYLLIGIFCKFSVPLFFAIAGALMLNRDSETLGRLWKKRILRIFLLLIFWSVIYYFIDVYYSNGKTHLDFITFFKRFYSKNWNFSYWYLYTYIPFLMTLPFLQRLVKNMTNTEFLYLFSLMIIVNGLLPEYQYLFWQDTLNINGQIKPSWVLTNIVIYPCLGYFLQYRVKDSWNKKRLSLLWLANLMTIGISALMTYYKCDVTDVWIESKSQTFFNSFVIINCVTIFVTCQYICMHHDFGQIARNIIYSVGGCTFGIYLLHICLKDRVLKRYWDVLLKDLGLNSMLAAFVFCGMVFILWYIITLSLKKIPYLRRLV